MDGRQLRCSDADREQVAEALRRAAGDGRLTLSTLEERLEATYTAQTYADLQVIIRDLPDGTYPVPPVPTVQRPVQVTTARTVPPHRVRNYLPARRSERITAIFRGQRRTAPWQVPRRMDVAAVFGDVTLDFCEATVPHSSVVLNLAVVRGIVRLIVPDGVEVTTDDVHRLASRPGLGDLRTGPDLHGGPVYRVRGFVLGGELLVRPPDAALGPA